MVVWTEVKQRAIAASAAIEMNETGKSRWAVSASTISDIACVAPASTLPSIARIASSTSCRTARLSLYDDWTTSMLSVIGGQPLNPLGGVIGT
jgi:hypothetical protein